MAAPKELSIAEVHKYMLDNGGKVTNHALVKHFKRFLTKPETKSEARKQFKTFVNILATIKTENNERYLILSKKYLSECPSEEVVQRALAAAGTPDEVPSSPGGSSLLAESALVSPRQPPPYKPPPQVESPASAGKVQTPPIVKTAAVESDQPKTPIEAPVQKKLVNPVEGAAPTKQMKQNKKEKEIEQISAEPEMRTPQKSASRANSIDEQSNKENIPRFSFSSGTSGTSVESAVSGDKTITSGAISDSNDNQMSVKEATKKFNRMASEEEAKIISPPSKKKPEQQVTEEVTLAHPHAKEWIVAMAKADYQELSKLANSCAGLVKLQDPATYTALHWAAKHGNEDVVKLIAGTYKADVNARTNGGYTPLHLAMQFGRVNIFELLCNVYKANRDLMDWSGNKPLDYSKQRTTVSASTYSKIKARRKHTAEKDSGFLRIGSLNVRVKKTTEAFSNFLGVGNGNTMTGGVPTATVNHPHQRSHRHHHHDHHHLHHGGMMRNHHHHSHPRHPMTTAQLGINNHAGSRATMPASMGKYDNLQLHKSWGSADNIPHNGDDDDAKAMMPPPSSRGSANSSVKKRSKAGKRTSVASTDSPRDSISSSNSSSNLNSGYSSMPTTPNQLRAPIGIGLSNNLADSDSDSTCGFGSNWSVGGGRSSLSSGNLQASRFNQH